VFPTEFRTAAPAKPARPPGGIASDASGPDREGAGGVSGAEERLRNAEELLDRLERTRARLEETTDPDEAIEVLTELSEIAKEVEAQLQQAKREAES
jgi:HAMP domain-containing protein